MSLTEYWENLGKNARLASSELALAHPNNKNNFLLYLYEEIMANQNAIIKANQKDIANAHDKNFDDAFVDRLLLNETRIEAMANGVKEMMLLPDPVGEITNMKIRPSGIRVGQMRVPLGVIAIIYESRPNVTIDAAALCLKSGNASVLRGGSEAFHSNQSLGMLIQVALKRAELPENAIQIINTTDRSIVDLMITSPNYIDVVIPRGGQSLVKRINAKATVPVIKHLDGICHTYVDQYADLEKAVKVVDNAKTQRYAPCNALETLLVHEAIAEDFLPNIGKIFSDKSVEMRVDSRAKIILENNDLPTIEATEEDWKTEYLSPIIAIKIVDQFEEAVNHINHYGSQHTDVIITENYSESMRFLRAIDSACVMINASSRFADGFEFGLGAEIGISTDKLHVRGPVGLEGLTSLKYIVFGDGEGRQ